MLRRYILFDKREMYLSALECRVCDIKMCQCFVG